MVGQTARMFQTIHCLYSFEHEACLEEREVGEASRFAGLEQAKRHGRGKAGRFVYTTMLAVFIQRRAGFCA